jgi:hypothetical protein
MPVNTPIESIRQKCMDCCCHQAKEVRLCEAKACPLWPYRMGKRPSPEILAELNAVDTRKCRALRLANSKSFQRS